VASVYDPIDVSQYTEEEFRAAVNAAEDWNTYVTVHAYTSRAIQTAIRAGVKCVEPEVLNPDGKTLQFRYLSALAAKFIDNIRINIDNIRINVDDFPAKLVPLD